MRLPRPLARSARAARDDAGAVLVMVALMMPVIIGMSGLVLDVGNWFAHKRHLQTQADAGALAGASQFRYPCVDQPILDEVSKYSSIDTAAGDPSYNPQIGNTPATELHQLINSETWYDQATPVDDTVRTGGPCAAKMIDVKLTETDLPWWLKLFGDVVPYINTHARVEIMQQTISEGALPVGVPEVDPKNARAIFVDETLPSTDANYVIASVPLEESVTTPGTWSNPVPKAVAIRSSKIGVRLAVSETTSTSCTDPLVTCYDTGSDNGLVHIRGWADGTGTATAPVVKDVSLTAATCEDAYFTATAIDDPCGVNVSADVDFGGASIATTRVKAVITGGNNNSEIALDPPAAGSNTWSGGGAIQIDRGAGPVTIDLKWQTGCNTDRTKPCNETRTSLGTVHRVFAASADRSGPVKLLDISEGGVENKNSFQRCTATYTTCTHDLTVTVVLEDDLENAQSVNDPIVSLKVAGGGSQNQALDCGTTLPNFQQEIASGCPERYAVNTGTACPGGANDLWNTPEPWQCVAIATGAQVGQVTHGMNERMFGETNADLSDCARAPNNWNDFPDFPQGDPRIIQVFLTPFNAFAGSGGTTVPVLGFASFYVTGWDGGPCQPPNGGDDQAGQGAIVGHFIKYIDTLGTGSGGEEVCDFNAFGSCVAVFTR